MSWSINLIGKPENVVKALTAQSEKLSGQSKVEYDEALPHFIGLVQQNFSTKGESPLVRINANGHGYAEGETQVNRQCSVKIDIFYDQLV